MRLSLIHCANTLLSTPGISKSAAADLLSAQCSLVIFEPISIFNSELYLNPELMIRGLSNSLRTGL
jgi:hypothetical protein